MLKKKATRTISLFIALSFVYSWIIFFAADAWLEPLFSQQGNTAAARLTVLMVSMSIPPSRSTRMRRTPPLNSMS